MREICWMYSLAHSLAIFSVVSSHVRPDFQSEFIRLRTVLFLCGVTKRFFDPIIYSSPCKILSSKVKSSSLKTYKLHWQDLLKILSDFLWPLYSFFYNEFIRCIFSKSQETRLKIFYQITILRLVKPHSWITTSNKTNISRHWKEECLVSFVFQR